MATEKELLEKYGNITEEQYQRILSGDEFAYEVLLTEEDMVGRNEELVKEVKKGIIGIKKIVEGEGEKFNPLEAIFPITKKVIFNIDNILKLEGYFEVNYKFNKEKELLYVGPTEFSEVNVKNPLTNEFEGLDLVLYKLKKYFSDEKIDINYQDVDKEETPDLRRNILESFELFLEQAFDLLIKQVSVVSYDVLEVNKFGSTIIISLAKSNIETFMTTDFYSTLNLNYLPETKYLYGLEDIEKLKLLPKDKIEFMKNIVEKVEKEMNK